MLATAASAAHRIRSSSPEVRSHQSPGMMGGVSFPTMRRRRAMARDTLVRDDMRLLLPPWLPLSVDLT